MVYFAKAMLADKEAEWNALEGKRCLITGSHDVREQPFQSS